MGRSAHGLCMLFVVACGGKEPDTEQPIEPVEGRGKLALSWGLSDGAGDTTCLGVGAVTVSIAAVPEDTLNGEADSFTCNAGFAETRNLNPGTYAVTLDLLATQSRSLLAEPIVLSDVVVRPGEVTELAPADFLVNPEGAVTWSMAVEGHLDNCDAGAGNVSEMVFEMQTLDGACVPVTFQVGEGAPANATCVGEFAVPCVPQGTEVIATGVPSGPHQLVMTARRPGPLDCFLRTVQFPVPGNDLEVGLGPLILSVQSGIAGCTDE